MKELQEKINGENIQIDDLEIDIWNIFFIFFIFSNKVNNAI